MFGTTPRYRALSQKLSKCESIYIMICDGTRVLIPCSVIVVKVSSESVCSGYEHGNIDLDIGAESYWPTRNLSANIPAAWMAVYYCALIRPGTSLRGHLWRCARYLLELLQSERQKRPEIVRTLSNIYLEWLLMTSRAGRDPLCSWATTWEVLSFKRYVRVSTS